MKRTFFLLVVVVASVLPFCTPAPVRAQVAGSTKLGVQATEMATVATGWSAKKQILGKTVYNEQNQKVGTIDDLIVAPDKTVSFAIVGAGGFAGVGKHDVAIPMNQLSEKNGRIILPGATKEAIKALPKFEYAKK
jgi:sporulation protein YlmC with PRC-barrel domain